jgi:hypothetical protein
VNVDHERDREQRLTLAEASAVLGVSKDAVRMRVRRNTLRSEKGEDGRVYVFVNTTRDDVHTEPQSDTSQELVEVLRAQVEDLQSRLDRETEANRENRRIIAGLIERVPELEAPAPEPRESDLSASEEGTASTPTEPRPGSEAPASRPWWRRVFGGQTRST